MGDSWLELQPPSFSLCCQSALGLFPLAVGGGGEAGGFLYVSPYGGWQWMVIGIELSASRESMQGGAGWLSASWTVLVLRKQRRLQGGRTGDKWGARTTGFGAGSGSGGSGAVMFVQGGTLRPVSCSSLVARDGVRWQMEPWARLH